MKPFAPCFMFVETVVKHTISRKRACASALKYFKLTTMRLPVVSHPTQTSWKLLHTHPEHLWNENGVKIWYGYLKILETNFIILCIYMLKSFLWFSELYSHGVGKSLTLPSYSKIDFSTWLLIKMFNRNLLGYVQPKMKWRIERGWTFWRGS